MTQRFTCGNGAFASMGYGAIRWLLVIVMVLSVVVTAAAGGGQEEASRAEEEEKDATTEDAYKANTPRDQLVIGMTMANVLQMDPHDTSSFEKDHIITPIYDRLIEMDAADQSKLIPRLAESWEFEEDGDLIFNLRKDAVFHSGNPVTAEDVVFSLRRPLLGSLNAATVYRSMGYTEESISELITAVDEYTVRLEKPGDVSLTILMYSGLAQAKGAIVDKKLVLENEVDGDLGNAYLSDNSAGSGPFELNRWNPNEIVLMDRFEDHWDGSSAMSRIIVRHIPEAQAQRLQIERGDIDMAYVLNVADYESLDKNPDVVVQKVVGDGYYHLAMNSDHPIFGNPEVRRAVRYLIPYEGLYGSVMTFFSTDWRRPIAKGYLGSMDTNLPVEYNVDKAKELLAQAGFADGFEAEILALSQPPFLDIATVFQEAAAPAGVKINVTQGAGSVVYGQMRQRDFDMIVGRALGERYGDPHSNMEAMMYNPDNSEDSALQNYPWRCNFQDETLNRMIEEAAAEDNEERRAELYREIQRYWRELSPPFALIGQRIDPFAIRAEVKGVVGHPSWTTRWDLARK